MRKFEFAPSHASTFTGFSFYTTYKDAPFLKEKDNIHRILNEGHQLRQGMKDLQPGESLQVAGMYVKPGQLLAVKKGGPNVIIEDDDFTISRLSGLTAAYVYENRKQFPNIESSEAKSLGLTWCSEHRVKARLYLASVSGSEHFLEQFSYWPFVCALRKVDVNKMQPEFLTKIAKIKNPNGMTMAQLLLVNSQEVKQLWSQFPKSSVHDFKYVLTNFDKRFNFKKF